MSICKPCLVLAILCAPAPIGAQSEPDHRSERIRQLVQGMAEVDPFTRGQAVARLRAEREATIAALMLIVRSDADGPNDLRLKQSALELLGYYRATQACDLLFREIEFRVPGIVDEHDPLNAYPAAKALLEIGEPGIRGLVGLRCDVSTERRLRLVAYVLRRYYAGEEAVGLFRLEEALRSYRSRLNLAKDDAVEGRAPTPMEDAFIRLIGAYATVDVGNVGDWLLP